MLTPEEVDNQEEMLANQKIQRVEDKIEAILQELNVTERSVSEKKENHRFMEIINRLTRDPDAEDFVGMYNIEELLQRIADKLKSVTESVPAHIVGEGKKFHELHPKEAVLAGLLLILYHRLTQIEIAIDNLNSNDYK